jgi:hypothetical protein
MLFIFTNISTEFSLYILSYSFCAERQILAHFCPILMPGEVLNKDPSEWIDYQIKGTPKLTHKILHHGSHAILF